MHINPHRFGDVRQIPLASAPLCGEVKAFLAGILLVSLASVSPARACGLHWHPPGGYFECCDNSGDVLLTEKLGDLAIPGETGSVPLWMWFSSKNTVSSPYAGLWRIGILDMSLVQISEKQFRLLNPGGDETLLSYDRKKNLLDGFGWKGEVAGDRVRLTASCGWKLEFNRGSLVRMTTPDNKILVFQYTEGLVLSVTCDGKPLMTVGNPVGASFDITLNGRKLTLAKTDMPFGKGREKSLFEVRGREQGEERCYTYPVDEDGQQMITSSDKNEQNTFTLSFDPKTRKIVRYKDWTYTKLRARKTPWDIIELVRTNALVGIESYYRDIKGGVDITQRGKIKQSKYTFTSGPAAGKIRRAEDSKDGKVTHFQKYAYDEKGRPIRGEENADKLRFEYDDKNRTAIAWKNGDLLWRKFTDVQGRTVKVEYPGKELRLAYRDINAPHPMKAELFKGGKFIAVQLDGEGLVKQETAVIKGLK